MTFRDSALLALGAAAATHASPAAATTPAEMWMGVERVVITCEFSGIDSPALRDSLCRQLTVQAGRLTAHPVRLAAPADLEFGPEGLARQDSQLLLRISVVGSTPSTLTISVRPERLGLRRWQGARSAAARVPVEGKGAAARLAQPVPALAEILAGPADLGRVPAPPRSRL